MSLREKQLMTKNKLDEALEEALGYVTRVGDASSQLVNVALLWGDNANESVSGRSHRLKDKSKPWGWLNAAIDYVFDENHCERAYVNDVARAKKTVEEAES
jgi:hypothetical protein